MGSNSSKATAASGTRLLTVTLTEMSVLSEGAKATTRFSPAVLLKRLAGGVRSPSPELQLAGTEMKNLSLASLYSTSSSAAASGRGGLKGWRRAVLSEGG